jgi:hypothetical protein
MSTDQEAGDLVIAAGTKRLCPRRPLCVREAGTPTLSIGEGLQAKDPKVDGRKFLENWIVTRYHASSDDTNQPLDFDATVSTCRSLSSPDTT